jgi:cyanophycin synthetase
MNQVNAETKIGIVGCAGDRRDEDIRAMGKCAAEIFDEIIIRHDKDGRGRTDDDITALITEGIMAVRPNATIKIISDETGALSHAMEHAQPGSFIVVATDAVQQTIEFVKQQQAHDMPEMAHNTGEYF